jgi:16S rRNA (cytosine967-C5)-methyltransferase
VTPAARVQAAIELLDEIIEAALHAGAAADTIIARYFKTRRYAGSGDRRAVRELVYAAIRRCGERPPSGRAALLGLAQDHPGLLEHFSGSPHGPASVEAGEAAASASPAPLWLSGRFDPLIDEGELSALLERAPLDLRVNTLKTTVEGVRQELVEAVPTPLSPIGLRLPDGTLIERHEPWNEGRVEVQDEGSQLLALSCRAAPGMTVVDLCAGAGGKTLALGAAMENQGRIIASDTDRGRLSRMAPRLQRAGVLIVEPRLLNPGSELSALDDLRAAADLILIDAPCSGTGTWRRNPETRWRLNPHRLSGLVRLQSGLLDIAAELVRPGGVVVYAVCSLLTEEGRGQAEAFAARRSSFVSQAPDIRGGRRSGPGHLLSPGHDGTDGFFVARWQAPC